MFACFARFFVLTCLVLLSPLGIAGEPAPAAARNHTDHYGDPLPKGVRFRLGTVRLRHDGPVTALAWLPGGHTLASAGADHTVRLWQIPDGKLLAKWEKMESIAFSPDGRTLACGGCGKVIRFHDVATGKELRRIDVPNAPIALHDVSTDGKFIAGIEELEELEEAQRISLYVTDTGKVHVLEEKGSLGWHTLAFSPNGRTLAMALKQGGLACWQTVTGKKLMVLGDALISGLAFSPDGKKLAAAMQSGADVCLWSWPEGKELRRFKTNDFKPEALAFSADSKILAIAGNGGVRLWNATTGEELHRFQGLERSVLALAFSPDGSLLASADEDGAITLWQVQVQRAVRLLHGLGHRLTTFALTGEAQTVLAGACDGTLTLWDSRDGHRLRALPPSSPLPVSFLLATPDGRRALEWPLEEKNPSWRNLTTGRRLPALSGLTGRTPIAAFSPDGSMLAVEEFGAIRLVETEKGEELYRLPEEKKSKVGSVVWSPDGRILSILYWDDTAILWDVKKNRLHHRLENRRLNYTKVLGFPYAQMQVFSPDSRLLAVASVQGSIIRVYEVASGREVRQLYRHPAVIRALAFASDNRTLASGGGRNRYESQGAAALLPLDSSFAIILWDVPTGKPIRLLRGHRGNVHLLSFAPDRTSLLSCSHEDNTILSWRLSPNSSGHRSVKHLSTTRLAEFWDRLAANNAARAQDAVAEMIQSPDTSLPFLEKTLLAVPPVNRTLLASLIADLDHAEFVHRDKASTQLQKIGELAAPALRQTLTANPSPEMRRRIADLLETIETRPSSPDWRRILRALQVLETIGSPQARRILEKIADGAAEASQTREAKASLQRLTRRNHPSRDRQGAEDHTAP